MAGLTVIYVIFFLFFSVATPMTINISGHENYVKVSNPIVPKIQNTVSQTDTRIGTKYLTKLYKSYQRQFRIESDGVRFTAILPYL